MKCPKCQRTITDDSSFCEWCGAAVQNTKLPNRQNDTVDNEILELVKNNQFLHATKAYKDKTGVSLSESQRYIEDLNAKYKRNEL